MLPARGALIVTGGGRGIGAATCRAAARDGWPVVVNYGKSREAAERVAADIAASGGTAVALGADVADETAVVAMFDEADALFGRVAGVVNNAGITGGFSHAGDIEIDRVRRMLDVNVVGTMLCCREAVRR